LNANSQNWFCATFDEVPEATAPAGFKSRAAFLNSAYWEQAAITVSFLSGSEELHQRVAAIAKTWRTDAGADVNFEFWIGSDRDPNDAHIRIDFQPGKGSWSHLGKHSKKVPRDRATMNLGWMTLALAEDKARAVVLHEFGHALGLIHEHMNPEKPIDWDRDAVIEDLHRTQNWDDATIERNMFAKYQPGTLTTTAVDPNSIMMYPIPAHWTRNGFSTGFNSELTGQDKKMIRDVYGRQLA